MGRNVEGVVSKKALKKGRKSKRGAITDPSRMSASTESLHDDDSGDEFGEQSLAWAPGARGSCSDPNAMMPARMASAHLGSALLDAAPSLDERAQTRRAVQFNNGESCLTGSRIDEEAP